GHRIFPFPIFIFRVTAMRNIKLTLAYDGTDFCGWQVQPGKPTIQGALNDVLRRITQEEITVHGAGRTDAGVHAEGQVAHFRTESALAATEFQRALNALLPPAVRVRTAQEVDGRFHARHQAVAKTYVYRIYRGEVAPPFLWRYVLHYPYPLDEEAMRVAAPLFEGEHDFTSFAALSGAVEDESGRSRKFSPVKTILQSELRIVRSGESADGAGGVCASQNSLSGGELVYLVRGRSFLRYMVRKMAGTLLEIGRGRMAPQDITKLFELRDGSRSGPTVAPQGLCMHSVEYGEPSTAYRRQLTVDS
ncbi:MAG: tRNA pseudouridine(38-40) synthase TruA, partial [Candidatus Acidiferrales bacterium]